MSTADDAAYQIDSALVDRANRRSADGYPTVVPDLIAERLFDRLALLKSEPQRVLDMGAGNGRHLKDLERAYPRATVFAADLSPALLGQAGTGPFWRRKPPLVCLDGSCLPFADETFDLVVSNLMLPWIHPPDRFAAELNRVLTEDGVFFFSTAGPDTLLELRQAWAAVDGAAHVNALLDMHDIGDLLLRAGIADPVMDAERLQIHYSSVDRLLDELIATGAVNVLSGRRKGLIGRDIRQRLAQHYPTSSDGGITATLEVVYAHGWKGQAKSSNRGPEGEYYVSVDALRR